MAVNEGTRRIVGGVDTRSDLHARRSWMSGSGYRNEIRRHHPSGLSPDARLDARIGDLHASV